MRLMLANLTFGTQKEMKVLILKEEQIITNKLLLTTMTNTQAIKAVLIKQIIDSGSNIPLGTLTGNINLLIKSAELDGFTQAKEIMFPTITDHPNTI
jgi:hypothetical protein